MPRAVMRKVKASFRPSTLAPGSFMKRATSCSPRNVTSRLGSRIQIVVGQHWPGPRSEPSAKTRRIGAVQREIEERVDAGIDAVESRLAALEERNETGIFIEHLAHHAEVRVFVLDRRHPVAPEVARNIGQRVLADAIHSGGRNPPQRVLDDVARHFRIVLVEIGQDVDEPAVERASREGRRGVRVHQGPGLPGVGQMFLRRSVEPGGRGGIVHPRMIGTGVVRDLVQNDLDAERVRRFHELSEIGQVAQVLVDAVEVDGAVAVVVGDGLAVVFFLLVQVIHVVVDRIDPEGGDAQILEIRQMLDTPCKIAAVIIAGLAAVEQTVRNRRIVVGRVAIGEAIGHDQVDHIVGGKTLETVRRDKGASSFERRGDSAIGGRNLQRIGARSARCGFRRSTNR